MSGSRRKGGRALAPLARLLKDEQLALSILALAVGAAGGGAVVLFREAIALVQELAYGSGVERLYLHAARLPWWWILLAPAAGGLVVGVLVRFIMPERRPHGLADAIEACALRGGRMSALTGLRAAVVSAVSIGAGASVGREGPAVHLGASLGGWLAQRLHLSRASSRTLLGCGVAAAVAASFNVPIAGALFASEVVIGHYALSAFAPVVIASVAGTIVSRQYFGDFPAFTLFEHEIASLWEFPAFAGLGVVAGLVAIVLMRGIMLAGTAATRMPLPAVLRPAVAGLAVGALAIAFPQVLGVGYGAAETALRDVWPWTTLLAVCAAKIVATSVSLGFGFGGGVFSPSLVVGATLGGLFGAAVTGLFPELSSGAGAYTLVGMGAVAAAVLGAPLSTTLIVFEMTGDYAITVAVMVAVAVSSLITRQLYGRSFFAWQLERRGYDLKSGFASSLLRQMVVRDVMSRAGELVTPEVALQDLRTMLQLSDSGALFVVREDGTLYGTITLADMSEAAFDRSYDAVLVAADVARRRPPSLAAGDDLDTALKVMRESGESYIAVVDDARTQRYVGCVHERDVMVAYNRALVESRREEHD